MSALRIIVNCFSISNERTGVGNYSYQLLLAMAQLDDAELHLVFAADAAARHDFAGRGATVIEASLLTSQALKRISWENRILPGLLKDRGADIYFSPDYLLPLRRLPCPAVVTIHDLAFISLPETKKRCYGTYVRLMVPLAARRASAVIAISDYTKGEVVRLLGVPEGKVERIYYGRDKDFEKPGGDLKKGEREPGPYILYVGALERRKNLSRLLEAFSRIRREGGLPHRLVLAGPRKFGYNEIRSTVMRLGLDEAVCEKGYLAGRVIRELYRGASLLVLPSLHEGFGLPLLEAMASGTPIAASNVTAVPEIAGDAALYFDPLDVGEMASAMKRLIKDRELRADLVRKGTERLKLFSWEKCARETMALFKSVVAARI